MENKADIIWNEREEAISYQNSMKMRDTFPEIIRFKEGDQWPTPTAKTARMPRPVFNITDMFIKAKRAAITNQPLSMTYTALESDDDKLAKEGAEKLTSYAKVTWENVDQDSLNNEFVDDTITLGSSVLHYYWDNNITGDGKVKYVGDIAGEVLDILNVYFSNPKIQSVQKQQWVIIETTKELSEAREYAKAKGFKNLELITPDNDDTIYDSDGKLPRDKRVTFLIKYYRVKNEVFRVISTKNVVISDASLTPKTKGANAPKITTYPVVLLRCKRRKNCIYGRGEAEDIITINKLYNQLRGMIALNVIKTGNPNILVKPNALKKQLTNESGQVIVDHYQGQGDGVKYMQPPTFSNILGQVATEIFEMARTVSGVTDVSTGEVLGANMAASAIIALQNQAKTPIREMQSMFFSAMKEVGDIWQQFYKCYFNTKRRVAVENANGEIEPMDFLGTDYAGTDFKTKVNIGISSEQESLVMSILSEMRKSGDVNKFQFVELAPDGVISFKAKLLEMWEEEETLKKTLEKCLQIIKGYQAKELIENGGMPQEGVMPNEMQPM